MFYCESCGQSKYISDDCFIEHRTTSGWETVYINCETGDVEEYGDSESTDSDHNGYECPYCNNSHINTDWDGEEEDAKGVREDYDLALNKRRKAVLDRRMQESVKDSDWDLAENHIEIK